MFGGIGWRSCLDTPGPAKKNASRSTAPYEPWRHDIGLDQVLTLVPEIL